MYIDSAPSPVATPLVVFMFRYPIPGVPKYAEYLTNRGRSL
jgi:hypothetical protein